MEMPVIQSDEATATGGCGCGCCGPETSAAPTRGEEIVELQRLRDAIDQRLEELGATV